MEMTSTVIVIDDHALFRRCVTQTISKDADFLVIGEAATGSDGVLLVKNLKPDLVLIDTNTKGLSGLQTLVNIKQVDKAPRCIVLTTSDNSECLLEAFSAGADGYLLKDIEPEVLCNNLRKGMSGAMVLAESLTNILQNAYLHPTLRMTESATTLTEREIQILECLTNGLNNKKIALNLDICETTVKAHIKNLLAKLGLTSRLQAAVWAHKKELFNFNAYPRPNQIQLG